MGLLLLVSLVWSFSFGLIGARLAGVPASWVAFVRLAFSLLVFIPFARRVPWRAGLRLAGIGAVQFGVMYLAYIASFGFLKSYEVALFTVFTPIYVAVLDDARRRRFDPANLAAGAVATAGAAIVSWKGLDTPAPLIGFALVQIANLCFAFGQVAYRGMMVSLPDHRDEQVFAWLYLGAVAIVWPSGMRALQPGIPPLSPEQWWVLAYLGLIASGVCFFLWNTGARRVSGGLLAVLNNVKIPLAVAVSLLVFGERADPARLAIGGCMILAGMLMASGREEGSAGIGRLALVVTAGRQVATRLRDGARRLSERKMDATCAWACLLLILALAISFSMAAWISPGAASEPAALRPFTLILHPLLLYACMLAVATSCAFRGPGPAVAFGFSRAHALRDTRDGLFFGLALVPVVGILSWGMRLAWRLMGFEPSHQETFAWLADSAYPLWSRLGLAGMAVIAAPVAEEALFRGVLLASLTSRIRLRLALLLQGALFALAHGHGPSIVPLMAAGIGFGMGYAANGSLVTPIVMHAVFNMVSLAFFFGG